MEESLTQQSQDLSYIKVNDVYARMLRGDESTLEFIESFLKFLRAYDMGMVENSYERWVREKIKRDGFHREYVDVEAALEADRQLYDDIKKNGVKVPVKVDMRMNESPEEREWLNGCHRVLISHHLGLIEIPCEVINE